MKKRISCVLLLLVSLFLVSCSTFDEGMGTMKKTFPGRPSPDNTAK